MQARDLVLCIVASIAGGIIGATAVIAAAAYLGVFGDIMLSAVIGAGVRG